MNDAVPDGLAALAAYLLVVFVVGSALNGVVDAAVFVGFLAVLAALLVGGTGSFSPGASGDAMWVVGVYVVGAFAVTSFVGEVGDAFFFTAMLALVVLFLWE